MALGDPYATLADLKTYLKITDTSDDSILTWALNSASREIEKHCQRQFNLDSGPTARIYEPEDFKVVHVDDFQTTSGLTVLTDPGGTGNFTLTLTSDLYELSPFNGMSMGRPWPYTQIRAVGGYWWPHVQYRRRATVQVTAQWGWTAVPDEIHQACLIMAAQQYRAKDAPAGVTGLSDFGPPVRVVQVSLAAELLCPFRRYPYMAA